MAVRVLNGAKTEDIPIVMSTAVYLFDWSAIQRWGIKETDLPPGSVVVNRVPGFWELYKRYVIVCILLLLIQALIIAALLWQRVRRRRAEAELAKSEEKFAKTFRQSPLVLAISRTSDSRFIDVNETFVEQVGWKKEEVVGRSAPELKLWADTDQRAAFVSEIQANSRVRDLEALIRRKDGVIRTFLVSAEVIDVAGQHCTLSVGTDITERKQAEEVLSSVSRRLIEAHEEERTWIARELHDDINQRVALVTVYLESLKENLPSSETQARYDLDETKQQVTDLGSDIQALSHRLHSSKLEHLGLETACRGFCRELSQAQGVEIEFKSEDVPPNLSKEISLCLFRTLQEALQNAVKHSGVRHFQVSLKGTSDNVELRVSDAGSGFNVDEAIKAQGLGLTSMNERLKLVHGQLLLDSKPGHGTTVHARVPLKAPAAAGNS